MGGVVYKNPVESNKRLPKNEKLTFNALSLDTRQYEMNRNTAFPTRLHVRSAETHISLRVRAV